MCQHEKPEDRVSIIQMCSGDLVRFGHCDVLNKSDEERQTLNEFYSAFERKFSRTERDLPPGPELKVQLRQAAHLLSTYLADQRELYHPSAIPLSQPLKALLWPYFSRELLDRSRILELQAARTAPPRFFAQVRTLGIEPPVINHLHSVTFLEVVVFNEKLDERSLFHALVRAVQIQILGLESYAELWVRGFARSRTHFTVPLEVHASSLASKFMGRPQETFSVDDHVLRWVIDERY